MRSHTDDLLSKKDEDLFANGGCHVFAVCLAETFGYPLRLLRNTSKTEPGGIVHVYCLPAPDVMIDFTGRGSERDYRRKNNYDHPPYHAETITHRRLQELSVVDFGRGGLYSEAGFVGEARSRALVAIASAESKYGDSQLGGGSTAWAAAKTLCWLPALVCALVGCSDNRKVVLCDEAGSRTLEYPLGRGFVPQAKVSEDLPVLVHSYALTLNDAAKDNDFLTVQTLQTAWKNRDYRGIERAIVEFRFREIEKGAK